VKKNIIEIEHARSMPLIAPARAPIGREASCLDVTKNEHEQRKQAAMKIIQNEKMYLFRLSTLLQHIGQPLNKGSSSSFHNVLRHIEGIYCRHIVFFATLRKLSRTWSPRTAIGRLFLEEVSDISAFPVY